MVGNEFTSIARESLELRNNNLKSGFIDTLNDLCSYRLNLPGKEDAIFKIIKDGAIVTYFSEDLDNLDTIYSECDYIEESCNIKPFNKYKELENQIKILEGT